MTPSSLPDLVSLRLLIDVGVSRSLGKSARRLQLSQPAASKRLALLERQLGLTLVDRSPSGSELTAQGQAVAHWADRILDSVEQLMGAVASLRSAAASDLRIAASMTIAEHLVPRWLAGLRAEHPEVHVGLDVANSEEVQRTVLDGHVDLGFVESPQIEASLFRRRIGRDRLAIVVDPAHPWAERRSVRLSEFVKTPLVLREAGSGTRATLEQALQGESMAAPLLELGSNEAVKGAVAEGVAPAVLSVLAVRRDLEEGRLIEVAVSGLDLSRNLTAVWATATSPPPPAAWLLETVLTTSPERRTSRGRSA